MRPRHVSPIAALLVLCPLLSAQTSIRYLADKKIWLLDAGETSYAFGVNERNQLQHIYWGHKLWRTEDLRAARLNREWASFDGSPTTTPTEYPGWGSTMYVEPAVKVSLENGVRDLVLEYVSHNITNDSLEVITKDIRYALYVRLQYRLYAAGFVERRSVIENRMPGTVTVESAQSAVWNLPPLDNYRLTYLTGRWAGETQLNQEDVHTGTKVIESRRGTTSHQANPWFALDAEEPDGGHATEDHGRVWFGALGWSGNWKFAVERNPHGQTRVTGGYNTFDFAYPLKSGETLDTPPFYGGFTEAGFGVASRMLHRFERAEILPGHPNSKPRPVIYNSWEATTFKVDEAGQKALAEKAAKLGVERFVMDDGWFGARNNDRAGLGDWTVNRTKFPNGLQSLIQYVHSLGMDFGLWVEPEMVNPDSDLYRAHPGWAMHMEDRPRTEARNQLVLNMARDDVKEYIFGVLDKLVSDNDIAFLKWDMNRNFAEPGWPEAGAPNQKKIWVQYTKNVYEIIDRLRARHPKLEIESCSGGGGRVDLGILRRTDEVWPSDNTDAFDRLRIQEGFSYPYLIQAMMAWVTDVPNFNGRSTPLRYRFHVAMMGALGIGANLNKWTAEDSALATKLVSQYKSIRATVQQGRLYRLISPRSGEITANNYVSEDGRRAVLFAFLHSQQYGREAPAFRVRGLDEKATYRVKFSDNKNLGNPPEASGAFLMAEGLHLRLAGDYDSTVVELERVE